MKSGDQISNLNDWLDSGFLLGLRHSGSSGVDHNFLIGWGEAKRHKALPKGQPALFAADFFLEDRCPWWTFEHLAILSKEELQQRLNSHVSAGTPVAVDWQSPEQSDFEDDFAAIQSAIEIGVIEKAVPVTFEKAQVEVDASFRAKLISNLLANYGDRTVYGLWQNDFGILGASPEILFSFEETTGQLDTMALAGTRKTDNEKQISLLLDPKEMFEHNVVVQDIKRKLKGLGEIEVSEPRVWDLGLISHLRSDFTVKVKKSARHSVDKIIRLMHPTPALGIASETESFKWLKNLNGADMRARFGAPFGVAHFQGRSKMIVAIRNIQWAGGELLLGSGCGIVAPSQPEREWQELQLKRRSVKELFNLL